MTKLAACPRVLPSAARPVHAGLDPVPDSVSLPLCQGQQHMQHEPGRGVIVPGVQPFCQGADVDALIVKFLDRFEPFSEVPGQTVEAWDHHRVPRP